jgi:PAS domain-containing protein
VAPPEQFASWAAARPPSQFDMVETAKQVVGRYVFAASRIANNRNKDSVINFRLPIYPITIFRLQSRTSVICSSSLMLSGGSRNHFMVRRKAIDTRNTPEHGNIIHHDAPERAGFRTTRQPHPLLMKYEESFLIRQLIDNAPDYLFIKDTESRFVIVNDAIATDLGLKKIEEALRHRIVMAVAASAHRVNQIAVLEERGPVHAGELRTLIGMNQHFVLRLSIPHRHEQSLRYDVRGLAALHRPAEDPARIEVDDDRKVSEALAGSDVGDTCPAVSDVRALAYGFTAGACHASIFQRDIPLADDANRK